MRPMRLPARKIPHIVMNSPTRRVGQVASAANVPESTTRSIACQNASNGLPIGSPPLTPLSRNSHSSTDDTKMMASITRPR